jgi:hypothetical protein
MRNTEKDRNPRRCMTRLIASVVMLSCIPVASAAEGTKLRCEYLAAPLGIDAEKPSTTSPPETRKDRYHADSTLPVF